MFDCVGYVFGSGLVFRIDKKEKQVILGKGTCNGIDTIHSFNPNNISTIVIKANPMQFKKKEK